MLKDLLINSWKKKLIIDSWNQEPKERPKIEEVVVMIENVYKKLNPKFSISKKNQKLCWIRPE